MYYWLFILLKPRKEAFSILCSTPGLLTTHLISLLLRWLPVKRPLRLFRRYVDFVCSQGWALFILFFEVIGKNRLVLYGDDTPIKEKRVFVIANHRWYIDWCVIFCLAYRKRRLGNVKMMIKHTISIIPGVGTAIRGVGWLALARSFTDDVPRMKKAFKEFVHADEPFWLLSHPEGTRFNEKKQLDSIAFAKKRDLPLLRNVLLPRTKGFSFAIAHLRADLDAVYDVTIGYEKRPPNILSIYLGIWPNTIHVFIKRYPIESLPKANEDVVQWLLRRYEEKDELMQHFKEFNCFPSESRLGDKKSALDVAKLLKGEVLCWFFLYVVTMGTFISVLRVLYRMFI